MLEIELLGREVDLIVVGLVSAVLSLILVSIELLHKYRYIHGEYGRKMIHISFGLILASLPIFASRMEIAVVCLFLFVGSVGMRVLKTVQAPFEVTRWTIGGHVYPISIGLTAAFFTDVRVYMIAVLHLALADGAAAVVGKLLGKKYYHLFGASKTYIGSSAFFGTSFLIFLSFLAVTGAISPINISMIIAGASILTLVEGSVGIGLDNLAVPLTAAVITEFLILNI